MVKKLTKECIVCGEEFEYLDMKNEPKTCGRRMCKTNYEYQQRHKDPVTGEVPPMEEIKKWEG